MDGRIINVGSGTGEMLTIDGLNLVYEGLPTTAQAGDTIMIKGGTYGMTWPLGAINIQHINVDGWVKITSDGDITTDGALYLTGSSALKGLDVDFSDHDVELVSSDDSLVVIDYQEVGGFENIKLRGFRFHLSDTNYSGIFHRGRDVPYDNGLGTIALKGMEIHDITITGACYLPISIGGTFTSTQDSGYCEDIHIHHLHFSNSSAATYVNLSNIEGFEVHDLSFDSVNVNAPGLDIFHWRMIFAKGKGKIYNCFARDSGGCVAAIEAFSRTAGQTCSIYNCYNYNSWRYGTTEFRAYTEWIISGITYNCILDADFLTYYRPAPVSGDTFSATCIDFYSDISGTTVNARNCVAVNPQNVSTIVNGAVGINSNNLVAFNNTTTKFDLSTMTPASDSVLKGAGITRTGISADLYHTLRLNPPTIGAVESVSAGRIINVGSGTGEMLTIDGLNLVYEGLPTTAQAGDTIMIKGGTYRMTWPLGAINIQHINVDGWVKITSDGDITTDGALYLTGSSALKGLDVDFSDHDVELVSSDDSLVVIDYQEVGGFENIKLRGFRFHLSDTNYSGIFHRGRDVPYDNGLGTIALKGMEIHDITITGACYLPISIGGTFTSTQDSGYCEDIHIHHLHFSNSSTSTYLNLSNIEGFEVHDLSFESVNVNAPGLDIFHWRMIFAKGKGKIYNCFARDSGGCVAAIEAFSRTAGQTCSIYNCYNYNSWRYGTTEFRAYTEWIISGITYNCILDADFLTYYRPAPVSGDTFSATCIDFYSDISGTTVNARNCVAVNPQNVSTIVNGAVGINSNNLVAFNNTTTKFDLSTMTPASDSVLKGAGITRTGISADLYHTLRLNPPTIGAVEANE